MGTDRPPETDLLVVGAGPTGLTLAAQTRLMGARDRVVDRSAQPREWAPALAVQPRTMEVLWGLGVANALLQRCLGGAASSARLFQRLLEETGGRNLTENLSLPVGLLVASGAVAAYHWLIWREDRVLLPTRAPVVREVTILAAGGESIADVVRRETGAGIRLLEPTVEASSSAAPPDVARAITDLASPRVLVVTDGEGRVRILGYHELS